MRKDVLGETIYCESLSERHLQAIWYDGALRPGNLRTTRGIQVSVLGPGIWNLEAGPDFRRAVLDVGGMHLEGDVEVHLRPNDWRAHGHWHDPEYKHVVAHVTWHGGSHGEALPPGCVHICLGDFLRTKTGFSPAEIDLAAYPYARPPATPRPCELRFASDVDAALAVMRNAGRVRLMLKARRMAGRFLQVPREQVLYEEMFSALGYKHNVFPFRRVAEAMPWRDVPANPEAARVCYECAAGLNVTAQAPWRLAHVRPANRPERRIAAAAALFSQGASLFERIFGCALDSKEGQRNVVSILREGGFVGPGRAGAILANAIIPYALATENLREVPEWIFPEDVSSPVRLTAFRMLGRDHNPALYSGNGLLMQGLIHIHHVCCMATHPACSGCPLARENAISSPLTEGS